MRLCGYCYVTEGIPDNHLDYDGSPLLLCSQCKLQAYKDREAQKAHWKLHKHSCKMLAQLGTDYETYESELDTLEQCFVKLKLSFGPKGGPELPFIIRRIRTLMDSGANNTGDMAFEMHSWARGVIFTQQNFMLFAMARPGMVQLMLSDGNDDQGAAVFKEDLLSNKARILKQLSKYNGRPTDEYIRDFITNEEEKNRVEELCNKHDALDMRWGEPSSMSFCYLYYNLLVAAAIQGQPSMTSVHDGRGIIRGSRGPDKSAEYMLATAALRRALSLWTDPLVVDSCGDAMAPAASLAITAITLYNDRRNLGGISCREHEIVPGLTVDGAVTTSFKELGQHSASGQYSVKMIKVMADLSRTKKSFWKSEKQPLWKDLPVERRAKVALSIVHYIINREDEDNSSSFAPPEVAPLEACNTLFKTVCGISNPENLELVKSVWTKACVDGDCIGPEAAGRNAEIRAFFYFLVRSEKYEMANVGKKIKEFRKIPLLHKAKDGDKLAKEKDECFKLARGEKLHSELTAIFSRT